MFDFNPFEDEIPSLEDFTFDMPDIEWIDSYERADGTTVTGHYRTVADDCLENNLG